MAILEKIYDKSPILFQNIMVSIKGVQNNWHRYGKTYWEYREFYREFDSWSIEKKIEYQNTKLAEFVIHAAHESPFYKEQYNDIDLSRILSADNLSLLPIVDKEQLRKNMDKVFTIPKKDSIEGHTGGTTGKSLVVRFSYDDMMRIMALLDHFKARVGFEHREMRRATFNGKHIIPPNQKRKVFWRYNIACKQMIYSSFHLADDNYQAYVDSLNSFKPQAIDGFFTSMCDVAGYIERYSIPLKFKPIAIFPTSETLTDTGRALLERVFKCPVYNQYASSEGAPFITECSKHKLHIEQSSGIFEHFADTDEVLVTSFHTHGTPLIRYRIGDSVSFSDEKCTCGNESLMVKDIQGRSRDFLYTAEGVKINGGNVANLFKNMPNALIRAQAIQNEMNSITILLEVDKDSYKGKYDQLLLKEFEHKFGLNTNIAIQHVDEIPREKSGKYRLIVNNVEQM